MSSVLDYPKLRRSWIAEGRRLTMAGEYSPSSQIDQSNVMIFRREQRRMVDRKGRCEGNCSVELVKANDSEWVCPLTWRPCPNRVLGSIVSLLAKVNG